MIARLTFVAADGTRSERVLEGVEPRGDRAGVDAADIAELLRRDRGAVSVSVEPWIASAA